MIREIVKYGDPVLRSKGVHVVRVTEQIKALASDMIETMRAAHGVGLAAQQVGQPIQLAVIEVASNEERPSSMSIDGKPADLARHMPLVILNPRLTLGKEKETGSEGCLSFPEISGDIVRSLGVHCKADTLDGGGIEFEATGLLARALQHEVDHLNGVLFIDRMNSATKVSLASKLKRLQRK